MRNKRMVAIMLLLTINTFFGIASAVPFREWSMTFEEGQEIRSVNHDGGYIYDASILKTDTQSSASSAIYAGINVTSNNNILKSNNFGPTIQNVNNTDIKPVPNVVIDFENLSTTGPGQIGQVSVFHQYSDKGITFNSPVALDYSKGSAIPSFAHSGTKAIEQCYGVEFCTTPIEMNFTTLQNHVKVWVGYSGVLTTRRTVILSTFNKVGVEVGNATAVIDPSSSPISIRIPIEVNSLSVSITRADVSFSPSTILMNNLAIDDVEFEAGKPLPCTSTLNPTVTIYQPVNGTTTQLNEFYLNSTVSTESPLENITVTAIGPEGNESSLSFGSLVSSKGTFSLGPTRINGLLFPGTNIVIVKAQNCRGIGQSTRTVNFKPIAQDTRFRFMGMEVTQTIQDKVFPLIANKRTFVHVYLSVEGPTSEIHDVSGYLTAYHPSQPRPFIDLSPALPPYKLQSLNKITVDSSTNIADKKRDITKSLNFELPIDWVKEGFLHLELSPYIENWPSQIPCDDFKLTDPNLKGLGCRNLNNFGYPAFVQIFGEEAPATKALELPYPFACNPSDLSEPHTTARADPEWAPILTAPFTNPGTSDIRNQAYINAFLKSQMSIVEGTISEPPADLKSTGGGQVEVSEEDIPWNHFSHDLTMEVIPDKEYKNLLTSVLTLDGFVVEKKPEIGIEWENHAVPKYVWPSVRDRVWIEGRWVFDCGHVGGTNAVVYDSNRNDQLDFRSLSGIPIPVEPIIAGQIDGNVVGTKLRNISNLHIGYVDSNNNNVWNNGETVIRDVDNSGTFTTGDFIIAGAYPLSTNLKFDPLIKETDKYVQTQDARFVQYDTEIHPPRAIVTFRDHIGGNILLRPPITGLESSPITEADMFVSPNGGGANDYCSFVFRDWDHKWSVINPFIDAPKPCTPTGPFIPVNDRNYVFDIYPPRTDFNPDNKLPNGVFPVHPPGSGTSLQWKTIDQLNSLDPLICNQLGGCRSVTPILCLIDDKTGAPTQSEASCPPVPEHPTRLRVILPFKNSGANIFSQTIILGWVPKTPNLTMRNFEIRLHEFRIGQNGQSGPPSGDWRVFADIAGQWRFISSLPFEQNNGCDKGDSLLDNGDGDCFRFDKKPWEVTIQNGSPIHIFVGGYKSNKNGVWGNYEVDRFFCRIGVLACNPTPEAVISTALHNDERIGTLEFDINGTDYKTIGPLGSKCDVSPGDVFGETKIYCYSLGRNAPSGDVPEIDYSVDFRVYSFRTTSAIGTIITTTVVPTPTPAPSPTNGTPGFTSDLILAVMSVLYLLTKNSKK